MFRSHPVESQDASRHGGRNRARYRFRHYCLPARLVLFVAFLTASLQWSQVHNAIIGLAAGTVYWTILHLSFSEDSDRIWWKREYLFLESATILFIYAIASRTTAVWATFTLLMLHWARAVYVAYSWPLLIN